MPWGQIIKGVWEIQVFNLEKQHFKIGYNAANYDLIIRLLQITFKCGFYDPESISFSAFS